MVGEENCPICAKPVSEAHKPFCSKRCADIDLGRWLKGSYVIAGRDGEAMSESLEHDENLLKNEQNTENDTEKNPAKG